MELEQFVNESGASVKTLWCADLGRFGPRWQPHAAMKHRPHMSFTRVSMALLAATLSWSVSAQSAVPAAPVAASVTGTLRPALAQVGQSLNGIAIRRWKAPNEVKSAADQDVASIQRDLSGTLATLMDQADAAPGSVPAAFAVYRNVDALYDTLLRVVLTANLAATDSEVSALQAVQKAPATTTVVDDGPAASASKSKHTTTKKPTSTPAKPANSSNGSPTPQ
jgi:hypothetical protein